MFTFTLKNNRSNLIAIQLVTSVLSDTFEASEVCLLIFSRSLTKSVIFIHETPLIILLQDNQSLIQHEQEVEERDFLYDRNAVSDVSYIF
jgi:hypothetical protein